MRGPIFTLSSEGLVFESDRLRLCVNICFISVSRGSLHTQLITLNIYTYMC